MEDEWPEIDGNLPKIGHGLFANTMQLKGIGISRALSIKLMIGN